MSLGRQWEERLKIWDEAFEPNLYRKIGRVDMEGFLTMERLSLREAAMQVYTPFPEGTAWGKKWEYGWFRCHITLPEETAGKRVMLRLGVASEMLVYVNGLEAGSIDSRHAYVQLTACAVAGDCFEIYAEAYAGHGPRLENGGIYPPEVIPVPEAPACQCVVGESSYGVWNEEMFQAYADYHTLYELWKVLPEEGLRGMQIAEALKEFTLQADFELPEPLRTESICRGRQALTPALQAHNGSTAPEFTVFGQSHLDLAWLWPWEETRRKVARTYANQLALMERYPAYCFLLCEPPLLESLKKDYPALYGRVKEKVEEGRFLPEGAVWVEGDTNMAGGESLIRQFVWGKRWFMKEFGINSLMAWMPDTFGFTGALPQIMKGCGVSFFATQKLLRCDPECEQFPYNLFWWEGIDGTRILSHIFKKNNAVFSPAAMVQRWEEDRNQREGLEGMLFPFGYGDGGGGPTEIMLETAVRCADLEGAPRAKIESPIEYFRRAQERTVENVYYGELYLAWHRGTYTAQARLKKKTRQAEGSLRQAEFLAGILCLKGVLSQERRDALEEMWKDVLFCEFHDILPGSSIRRVNEEAEASLEGVIRRSRELAYELLTELAGEGAVFNSLSWERRYGDICIPPCGYVRREEAVTGQAAERGRKVEADQTAEEGRLWADGQTAAGREAAIWAEGAESPGQAAAEPKEGITATMSKDGNAVVENRYYRAEADRFGRIVSLRSRSSGYEYAAGALNELRMYRDVNTCYDAWELGRMYDQAPVELGQESERKLGCEGDAVCLEICREEAYFSWRQEIVFRADSPRIEFRTTVDWHERHKILKAEFPASVYTREAIEEIPFGYLKRPTHKSRQYERDLYETCHHRYAALSDGKNGLAVLNDCKYGISAKDSTLALTLLRAPVIPDMEADLGEHCFTYALCLFDGPFTESGIVREAYELNIPLTMSGGARAGKPIEAVSFFSVDRHNVIVETCKPAMDEDSCVALRLYECMGSAVKCRLSVPGCVRKVWSCNMLEERQRLLRLEAGAVELDFKSFEIKTLVLEV